MSSNDSTHKVISVVSWIITALILFGIPFGIGVLVGYLCR